MLQEKKDNEGKINYLSTYLILNHDSKIQIKWNNTVAKQPVDVSSIKLIVGGVDGGGETGRRGTRRG